MAAGRQLAISSRQAMRLSARGHHDCCGSSGGGGIVAAAFFGQQKRVAALSASFCCDGSQPKTEAFERVVPQHIASQRIEAKDLATNRRQNHTILDDDVDKIRAFELGDPNLPATGTIQCHDRSFDSYEYQVFGFHIHGRNVPLSTITDD